MLNQCLPLPFIKPFTCSLSSDAAQVYKLAGSVVQVAGWAAGRQIAPSAISAARLELYGHPSGSVPSTADTGARLERSDIQDHVNLVTLSGTCWQSTC